MTKTCRKCSYVRSPSDVAPEYECPKCGAVYAKIEALFAAEQLGRERVAHAKRTGAWDGIDPQTIRDEARKIILSTTSDAPGSIVESTIGIVSADYAYAFGALFESVAGLARNIIGSGKSGQTATFLREGRAEVLSALRFHALDIGADAIIGVKIDYEEFSGANNLGVLVVTATGTAVKIT